MRKIFSGFVMGVLMVSLVLGGCAAPAPSPAPTTAPAPAPAPAPSPSAPAPALGAPAAVKPIILRLSSQTPGMDDVSNVAKQWADMVDKQSVGRLKIQLFFAGSLAPQSNVFRAVQTGVADIGYYSVGTDASITPLNMITRLPLLGFPSQKATGDIHKQLLKDFPQMEAEFSGMKIVTLAALPPDHLHFTKKEVRVPADVKGTKIIAGGDWQNVLRNIGASPVAVGVGDWYTSLERGLAEGQVIGFTAARSFKTLDLLKYHTMFGEGGSSETTHLYMMNLNSFNSLPPDLQKVILDTGKWQEEEMVRANVVAIQQAVNQCETAKHIFTNLTPEEIKLWINVAKPVIDKWIADNEAKGLPAQAVYDETLRLIKQYSK